MKEQGRPDWEAELRNPPLRTGRDREEVWSKVEQKLMEGRMKRRWPRLLGAGGILAACAVLVFVWNSLGTEQTSLPVSGSTADFGSIYQGIEPRDFSELASDSDVEIVHAYKGHTDNWAVMFIEYQKKESSDVHSTYRLKYIGSAAKPAGLISYTFSNPNRGGGSSNAPLKDDIIDGGQASGSGPIAPEDTAVSFRIDWDKQTEMLVLQGTKAVFALTNACNIPPTVIFHQGRNYMLKSLKPETELGVKLGSVGCSSGQFVEDAAASEGFILYSSSDSDASGNLVFTGDWGRALYLPVSAREE